MANHKEAIEQVIPVVDRYLSNSAVILGWLFLPPVLAIFFLRDGGHVAIALIHVLVPAERRARVHVLANEIHEMLARYMRAQVILCGFSLLFYSGALLLLRFPFAIVIALLGSLLEFVPVVGWTSTFAVIIAVGIVNQSHWLWMAVLLAIWRVIQDYIALPRIMGQQLKIHPLAAIFAVLVGAELGGIVGIYLAIPLMASVRLILMRANGEERELGCRGEAPIEAPAILAQTVTD